MCPVAVEQLIAVGEGIGWDMASGYLFSDVLTRPDGTPKRGSPPVTTVKMTTALKQYG